MARLRLYPHRMADVGSVSWHSWWIERDGSRSVLPSMLTGWDYASEETVGITVDFDEEALLKSTGLFSAHELEVLAMADCAMIQQRFVARQPLVGYESGTMIDTQLRLPRGRVAGSISLSAHLVLALTAQPREDQVAYLRGARIHSSVPFTVRLEGTAGRFPTEAVPFSELGFGNAPWSIVRAYDQLSDSFMGGIRLLINTEHPMGRLSLQPTAPPWVGRLLRMELMRLLIAQAADQVEAADELSFEEGSISLVLEQMCSFFLGRSLKAAVRAYRDDPTYFELLLHDHLDPLSEVTA
jgi:hypothetical protein